MFIVYEELLRRSKSSKKAWITKDKVFKTMIVKKKDSLHVIAAFSFNGFLGIKIFTKRLKSSEDSGFVLEMLKNDESIKRDEKYVIFWDDATVHGMYEINRYLGGLSIDVFYNAPRSPQLNPIELGFSRVKDFYRRSNLKNKSCQMVFKIVQAFQDSNARSHNGIFRSWLRNVERAYEEKPLK